jgi:hypothetical protein
MGRGPLVRASRDGGSANDLDRYDRESDETVRGRRDRYGAAGGACAGMWCPGIASMSDTTPSCTGQ